MPHTVVVAASGMFSYQRGMMQKFESALIKNFAG